MAGKKHIRRRTVWTLGLFTLFIVHCSWLFVACTSIDCPVQTTIQTNYAIMDADGNSLKLEDTLYVWTPRADGKDTLLLNRGVNIKSFALPISGQQPEDTLIFYVVDTLHRATLDTIWVKKDNMPHFESVDCNTYFFHRLIDVRCTHRGIESVSIINSDVDFDISIMHLDIRFKKRD